MESRLERQIFDPVLKGVFYFQELSEQLLLVRGQDFHQVIVADDKGPILSKLLTTADTVFKIAHEHAPKCFYGIVYGFLDGIPTSSDLELGNDLFAIAFLKNDKVIAFRASDQLRNARR